MPAPQQEPLMAPRKKRRLPGSPGARLTLVDQAMVSGSNFLNTVILVRALGLSGFGDFSMLWLVVVFFLGLQRALLGQPLMTFVPKQDEQQRASYMASVLRLAGIFSVLVALATAAGFGVFTILWSTTGIEGSLPALLLLVVSKQAHEFLRSACFSTGQRDRAFWNDVVAYPGQPLVLAALWLSGSLTLVSALWVIGGFCALGCLPGLRHYAGRTAAPEPLGRTAQKHWTFSRWISFMVVIQWFGSNSYLVAAAALLGTSAVGALKAAHTVIGVLHLVFLTMENVVPVNAAKFLAQAGRPQMTAYLKRIGGLGFAGTGIITILLVAFPHFLLSTLYSGVVTDEMVIAMRGLAVMYLFAYAISLLNICFRTIERTRVVFLTYLTSTLVAVCLAETVVARFGFEGAVFGMLGQQAFLALIMGAVWWLELRQVEPAY